MAYVEVPTITELRAKLSACRRILSWMERDLATVVQMETEAANNAGFDWPIDDRADYYFNEFDDHADDLVAIIDAAHFRYPYVIQAGRPAECLAFSSATVTSKIQITANDGEPFAQMVAGGASAGDKVSLTWTDAAGGVHTLVQNSVGDPSSLFVVESVSTSNRLDLLSDFPDHVTNGAFTGNADNWTLGTGWAYGTNDIVATLADTSAEQANADQTISLVQNCTYTLSFDWTRTAGTLTPKLGTKAGTAISSGPSGSFSEDIIAEGANPKIDLAGTGFSGTIDNVVIKPAHFTNNTSLVVTLEEEWQ